MLSIFRREWQNYFLTPSGYVFCGVFLLVGGVFFFLNNILSGSADVGATFSGMIYLFMIVMPILTMRLFSEERRQRTDQLLFTAPVSLGAIVTGKFLAACAVLLVSLALTGPYVFVLLRYAKPSGLALFSSYAGFFLLGCCYLSVGVLMSSLTENLVSAAMLTFGANLLLQVLELVGPQVSVPGLDFLPRALSFLSLYRRYDEFAAGVIAPANALYFGSFMAVMLFLSARVLQRRRSGGDGGRKRRALGVLFLCALCALNLSAGALENRLGLRLDVTETRVTALDAQTQSALSAFRGEARVYTLFQNGTTGAARVRAEEMLARCAALCDALTVENIDPVRQPGRLTAYDPEKIEEGAVLVTNADGTRFRLILPEEYAYYAESPFDGETYEVFDLEARLLSALRYVSGEDAARALFLTGHNELNPQTHMTQFWQQLANRNCEPGLLDLSGAGASLQADDTLLVIDPQRDLTDAQAAELRQFLLSGGRMLVCLSNVTDVSRLPRLTRLLAAYQLGFGEGLLLENERETARWQQNPYYLVPVLSAEHPVTAALRKENGFVLFPQTRPLSAVEMPLAGHTYTSLLTTSASAVVVNGEERGAPGACSAAMAMEAPDGGPRIVLVSGLYAVADTDFIYCSYNLEFALGCVEWLCGAQEAPAVQAKMAQRNVLAVPDSQTAWTLGALLALALPALVFAAGFAVRIRRRRL